MSVSRRLVVTTLAAVLAVAPVVTGCGDDEPDGPGYPKDILAEYRPRFDPVRAAIAAGVTRLPTDPAPATGSCARRVEPAFDYVLWDWVKDFEPGNTETVLAEHVPDLMWPRRPPPDRFWLVPGFLARALQSTGDRGPLGSNEFTVDDAFARDLDDTHSLDRSVLLRKVLDGALRIRYLVVMRVTAFTPPSLFLPQGVPITDNVRVDAAVLDLVTGDVPCRFRASGMASSAAVSGVGVGGLEDALMKDVQDYLNVSITQQLRALTQPG